MDGDEKPQNCQSCASDNQETIYTLGLLSGNGDVGQSLTAYGEEIGSPGTWTVTGITGQGTEVYYSFIWGGGAFGAALGLTELGDLESDSFLYTFGSSASGCTDQAELILNSLNGFSGSLTSPSLAAGTYCIGFDPYNGNIDPNFTLTFNTPVEGVTALTSTPEPTSFALLSAGLIIIGAHLFKRENRRPL